MRYRLGLGSRAYRVGGLLLCALALATAACTTSSTPVNSTSPPPPSIAPATTVSGAGPIPGHDLNKLVRIHPYRLFPVTRGDLISHGLLLGRVGRLGEIKIKSSTAIKDVETHLPRRLYPPFLYFPFLVKYAGLSQGMRPPLHRWVICWGFLVHGILPRVPVVISKSGRNAVKWTVDLINAETGSLQGAFAGASRIRLPPPKSGGVPGD